MKLKQAGIAKMANKYFSEFFAGFQEDFPYYDIHATVIGEVERSLIGVALKTVRHNQTKAAKLLGISRNTLRSKIKSLKIHEKRK